MNNKKPDTSKPEDKRPSKGFRKYLRRQKQAARHARVVTPERTTGQRS